MEAALDALYDADFQVPFLPFADMEYGYDTLMYPAMDINGWYPSPRIIAGNSYNFAWKSMPRSQADPVKAITRPGGSIGEVNFTRSDSSAVASSVIGGENAVRVEASREGGSRETSHIFAIQEKRDSNDQVVQRIAGQLNLVEYDELDLNLVIVPVNGASPTGVNLLGEDFNVAMSTIFKQAVVRVNLSIEASLSVPEVGVIADNASGIASYNSSLRRIIRAHQDQVVENDDAIYIFLVDQHENPEKVGFMPRKRNHGFIFLSGLPSGGVDESITPAVRLARAIGHEVGHGAYHLQHIVQETQIPERTTDNLMDYAGGGRLHKWQWDLIHDPVYVAGLFEGDEDGSGENAVLLAYESFLEAEPSFVTNNLPCSNQFQTSQGAIVEFTEEVFSGATPYYNAEGRLTKIIKGVDTFGVFHVLGPPSGNGVRKPRNQPVIANRSQLVDAGEYEDEDGVTRMAKKVPGMEHRLSCTVRYCSDLPVNYQIRSSTGECVSPACPQESATLNLNCASNETSESFHGDDVAAIRQGFVDAITRRESRVGSIRTKGVFDHLSATANSRVDLKNSDKQVLEENLFLYREKTNNGFYVLYHRVDDVLSPIAATNLLEEVVQGAELPGNTVYVLIAYSPTGEETELCGSTAFYIKGNVEVGNIASATQTATSTAGYIKGVFAEIEKPLYSLNQLALSDGSIFSYLIEIPALTGLPFINQLNFYESAQIDVLKSLPPCSPPLMNAQNDIVTIDSYLECIEANSAVEEQVRLREEVDLDQLLSSTNFEEKYTLLNGSAWKKWNQPVNVRAGYVTNRQVVVTYTKYQQILNWSPFLANLDYVTSSIPEGTDSYSSELHGYNDISNLDVIDPILYGAGDILGFVPGVGDFADGLLLMYASVVRHDPLKTLEYAVSFAAFGGIGNVVVFLGKPKRWVAVAELGDDGVPRFLVKSKDEVTDVKTIRYSILAEQRSDAEAIFLDNANSGFHRDFIPDELYVSPNFVVPDATVKSELSLTISNYGRRLAVNPSTKISPKLCDLLLGIPDQRVRQELLVQLDELDRLGKYDDFLVDLNNGTDEFVNFFRGPADERVRAWEVLFDFPTLRNQVTFLETLATVAPRFKYLVGTSPLENFAGLKEVLTGHVSAQNFINNLKATNELFADVEGLVYSGIKSSQEVRILGDGVLLGKVVGQELIPGSLVRAWERLYGAPDLIRLNTDVLESMSKLIQHNLIDNIGGATSSHLANIHKYTALGDYLNQPMRVPITNVVEFTDVALPPFEFQSYRAIVEGLQILRQTSRLETGVVLRGRPLSGPDFDRLFGSGSPLDIPVKGFVSTTRDRAVAEAFASMGSFPGLRYRMVWKIKSKNGVDINDLSDWGENLGPLYHADAQPPIIMNQQEVLLEEGYFRKINEPTSIMENGSPKVDYDTNGEPIYWMEVELEELGTPIRQITSQ